ncbi:MAG: NAD(P)H-dependent oxidoreductase subunit E [Nitrospiraceae bacterium]|nr:NAD(P)H-dependent oxidoreductase subunit E [Nitrospiraceae bacterium]
MSEPGMVVEGPLAGLEEIKKQYPTERAALMPALHAAQREFGWLSHEALAAVASRLNLPEATVRSTASFYSMFQGKNTGRHAVRICTNVACMVLGAEGLLDVLNGLYGLAPGQTSPDGRFSLEVMECIGACDKGPSMLVNEDLHTDLSAEKIIEVLETYE